MKKDFFIVTYSIILTAILGSSIAYFFNQFEWRNKLKYEQNIQRLKAKQALAEEIINQCQTRYYYSEIVYRFLEENNTEALKNIMQEYSNSVRNWNLQLYILKTRTNSLFNKDISNLLCEENLFNKTSAINSVSAHGSFIKLGKQIYKATENIKNNKDTTNLSAVYTELQGTRDNLNILYTELYKNIQSH